MHVWTRAALLTFMYRFAELRVRAFVVARGFGAFRYWFAELRVRAVVVARAALGRVGVGLRSVGLRLLSLSARGFGAFRRSLAELRSMAFVVARAALGR